MTEDYLLILAVRAMGGLAGGMLAVFFVPPKSYKDTVARLGGGVILATLFTGVLASYILDDVANATVNAGTHIRSSEIDAHATLAAVVAMLGWYVAGIAFKVAEQVWHSEEPLHELMQLWKLWGDKGDRSRRGRDDSDNDGRQL